MTTNNNSDMPIISQALQVSITPCTSTSINSQGKESPSTVVYMPISPVAVVSPVQVRFISLIINKFDLIKCTRLVQICS